MLLGIEFYNGIVRFRCHSTHFCWFLSADCSVFIYQKVTSTRKNQLDRRVNEDK